MHSASSSNQSPVCQIELDDGLIDINKKVDGCQGQKRCSHMMYVKYWDIITIKNVIKNGVVLNWLTIKLYINSGVKIFIRRYESVEFNVGYDHLTVTDLQ